MARRTALLALLLLLPLTGCASLGLGQSSYRERIEDQRARERALAEAEPREMVAQTTVEGRLAEGDRAAEILRAEGDKQSQILAAEGRREAAFRDAEAREREAEAEAKATTMVSDSIASGNVTAVNYFVAQRYVEAVEKMAAAQNQKVIFMPLEASALIGSLGGIGELARATFGGAQARDGS